MNQPHTPQPTTHRRRYPFVFLCVALLLASGPTLAASGSSSTITSVTGDTTNGFSITYADGAADFPVTITGAGAECSEYFTPHERLVCRVETQVWYHALGRIRDASEYAVRDRRGPDGYGSESRVQDVQELRHGALEGRVSLR